MGIFAEAQRQSCGDAGKHDQGREGCKFQNQVLLFGGGDDRRCALPRLHANAETPVRQ